MIQYLVMDVDGSLTDGKIYMGVNGESHKAFSVKDGYAINYILRPHNIEPIIITARSSKIVENRCNELRIDKVYQGHLDKLSVLMELVGNDNLNQCAYFGDDILDLKCMIPIKKAGGIVGCPSDAVEEVKSTADYVCKSKAGEGALREFSEWLVKPKCDEIDIQKRVEKAIAYIEGLQFEKLEVGTYVVDNDFCYMVQEYCTKSADECKLESHRKYIDIQWVIEGCEAIEVADTSSLSELELYNKERDVVYWNTPISMMRVVLQENAYAVFYPRNAHMTGIKCGESVRVKKIVGKIKIED